jgi:D-xylulose reductase
MPMMARAPVLEKTRKLSLRENELENHLTPTDVQIRVHTVGICGSDIHYYTHGPIDAFVVDAPMVLGHEASGTVVEVDKDVGSLAVGGRVCLEPGIPDPTSRASRLGIYNLDPAVSFWATPPIHGCLTPEVVHPAAFTYKLPDNVNFAEAAMVEPLTIGVQAAVKAKIKPGDVCVVTGAWTTGMIIALAALAGRASTVIVTDRVQEKLDVAGRYAGVVPVNVTHASLRAAVDKLGGKDWGADIVFEASGAAAALPGTLEALRPGGTLALVGMPVDPVPFDIVSSQAKEVHIETVFRYANVYDRAMKLIASRHIDLKPLIPATYPFERRIEAFERAAEGRPTDIKLQIALE